MKRMLESIRHRWTTWTRQVRGLRAGLALLRDPSKLDEVFVLDEAIPDAEEVLARIVAEARNHETGRRAIAERTRLALDLAPLRALPATTFGHEVAAFFDRNGLDPSSIPTLAAADDATYVQAHLYETHDVWHVATGFDTDVAGEIGLQAFYAVQLPGRLAPLLVAGGLLQAVLFAPDDFPLRLAAVVRGYQMGTNAHRLFGVRWGDLWERPLDDVRSGLGLAPASAM